MIPDPNISQSFGRHSAAFVVGCAWQALMLDLSRWRRPGVSPSLRLKPNGR